MNGLFNVDSRLMRLLARLTDIVLLNILFIVASLPIVTIGAAWTSLLTSWQHILRGHDNELVVGYFRLFKSNWKQATILWGITTFLMVIFVVDFILLQQAGTPMKYIGKGILLIFTALLLSVSSIWFAYIGRYQDKLKQVIKNSFIIMINQLPWGLLLLFLNGGMLYLSFSSPERLLTAIYCFTFFAFSLVASGNAWIMKKIFIKLETNMKVKVLN